MQSPDGQRSHQSAGRFQRFAASTSLHHEGKAAHQLGAPQRGRQVHEKIISILHQPVEPGQWIRLVRLRRLPIEPAKRNGAGLEAGLRLSQEHQVITQNQVGPREQRHRRLARSRGAEEQVRPTLADYAGSVNQQSAPSQKPVRRDDPQEILHGAMQWITLIGCDGELPSMTAEIEPPGELVSVGGQPLAAPNLLEAINLGNSVLQMPAAQETRHLGLDDPNPAGTLRLPIRHETSVAGPYQIPICFGESLENQVESGQRKAERIPSTGLAHPGEIIGTWMELTFLGKYWNDPSPSSHSPP